MGKGRTVGTDRDRGVKGAPSASIDTHYWVYYGLQLAAGSIPLRRHLGLLGQDFPNRINLLCETVYKKAVKRLYGLGVLKKAGMSTGDLVQCTARLYDLP